MRAAFLSALVAAIAQARIHWSELHNYTFEQFAAEYNLNLNANSVDYVTAREAFHKEHARVIAHNKSNATWKETINHMSAMTPQERKAMKGRNKL